MLVYELAAVVGPSSGDEDGFDQVTGGGDVAAELIEDAPGFQGGEPALAAGVPAVQRQGGGPAADGTRGVDLIAAGIGLIVTGLSTPRVRLRGSLCGSGATQTAVIRGAASGTSTAAFDTDFGVTFSPGGSVVASVKYTGTRKVVTVSSTAIGVMYGGDEVVELRDTATGHVLASLPGHKGAAYVLFSPDGKMVATAGMRAGDPFGSPIRLWDTSTGRLLSTLSGHDNGIQNMRFSRDGKVLICGAAGCVTKIWDVATGRAAATPDQRLVPMWISPDGTTAADRKPGDKGIELRSVPGSKLLGTITKARTFAGFSPDSKTYATNTAGTVKLFDVATRKPQVKLTAPVQGNPVFSPDGSLIATVTKNGVGLFDTATGQGLTELTADNVTGLAFTTDGQLLLTAGTDKTVRRWYVHR